MKNHRAAAQARKARALLAELDRQAGLAGLPRLEGFRGAESLRALPGSYWKVLARTADVNPPSRDVIAQVLRAVERRAPVTAPGPRQMRFTRGFEVDPDRCKRCGAVVEDNATVCDECAAESERRTA